MLILFTAKKTIQVRAFKLYCGFIPADIASLILLNALAIGCNWM